MHAQEVKELMRHLCHIARLSLEFRILPLARDDFLESLATYVSENMPVNAQDSHRLHGGLLNPYLSTSFFAFPIYPNMECRTEYRVQ